MPLIRVEGSNPHARFPVVLDEFELLLIFYRFKEGSDHASFNVHVAGGSIRLEIIWKIITLEIKSISENSEN